MTGGRMPGVPSRLACVAYIVYIVPHMHASTEQSYTYTVSSEHFTADYTHLSTCGKSTLQWTLRNIYRRMDLLKTSLYAPSDAT